MGAAADRRSRPVGPDSACSATPPGSTARSPTRSWRPATLSASRRRSRSACCSATSGSGWPRRSGPCRPRSPIGPGRTGCAWCACSATAAAAALTSGAGRAGLAQRRRRGRARARPRLRWPACCWPAARARPRSASRAWPRRSSSVTCSSRRRPRCTSALLVLAGGAGQAALAIAAWPLRRHRPERVALAGALPRDSRRPPARPRAPAPARRPATTLTAVRQTLYGLGHDHGPSVEAYRVLLDEAERHPPRDRRSSIGPGRAARGQGQPDPGRPGARRRARPSAGVLDEIADALAAGPAGRRRDRATRPRGDRGGGRPAAGERVRHRPSATRRAAAARLRALSGSCGPRWRARGPGPARVAAPGRLAGGGPWLRDRLADPCARAWPPDSAVLRHAARVARARRRHRPRGPPGRHRPRLLGVADRARRAAPGLRRDAAAAGHADGRHGRRAGARQRAGPLCCPAAVGGRSGWSRCSTFGMRLAGPGNVAPVGGRAVGSGRRAARDQRRAGGPDRRRPRAGHAGRRGAGGRGRLGAAAGVGAPVRAGPAGRPARAPTRLHRRAVADLDADRAHALQRGPGRGPAGPHQRAGLGRPGRRPSRSRPGSRSSWAGPCSRTPTASSTRCWPSTRCACRCASPAA